MSVRSARQLFSFVSLLIILSLLLPANHLPASAQQPPVGPAAAVPTQAAVSQALGASPVMFIENAGQCDDGARFQVRGGNGTMWLAEDAIWITVVERGRR